MAGKPGRSGRRPKPTALHRLQGTYRKDRHGGGLEVPPGGRRPRRPRWLTGHAREAWDRLAPDLHAAGVLTELDVGLLSCLCTMISRQRNALAILDREGSFYTNARGRLVQHPAARIANQAAADILSLACEFGMTPRSRSAMGLTM